MQFSPVMSYLLSRRIVSVRGQGAATFLQGLVTQDVQSVSVDRPSVAAAFLNPKGRVMSTALLLRDPEGFLIDLPKANADAILSMLTRHKLRLPLSIKAEDGLAVAVGTDAGDVLLRQIDPRCTALPTRTVIRTASAPPSSEPDEYRLTRTLAGIVESECTDGIPIFFNLDLANAISFTKGCYTGQELVTRTLRRGVVRRRIFVLRSPDLQIGQVVKYRNEELGAVVSAVGDVGLAMLQLGGLPLNEKEQVRIAFGGIDQREVRVGENPAQILLPSYIGDS